jgi:hypothetical protein
MVIAQARSLRSPRAARRGPPWAGTTLLSIGKLGRGAEGYYLRAIAAGVED